MFTRTPDTFTTGQEICWLDCRYGDRNPELKNLFVVGTYIIGQDRLGVHAVPHKEWLAQITLDSLDSEFISSEDSRWHHYESIQGVFSASLVYTFFLPKKEVDFFAELGRKKDDLNELLEPFSPYEIKEPYSFDQSKMVARWLYYWKSLHPRSKT